MNPFRKFIDQFREVGARASGLRMQLLELEQRKFDIEGAPPARQDLEAHLEHLLAKEAREFPARLVANNRVIFAQPVDHENLNPMDVSTRLRVCQPGHSNEQPGAALQAFMFATFPDQVRAVFGKVLDAMDFSEAGLPLPERTKALEKVDKEIAAARTELEEIESMAREVFRAQESAGLAGDEHAGRGRRQ